MSEPRAGPAGAGAGTWVGAGDAALLTDLYELTMAAVFHGRGMVGPATFELYVRELPPRRNFLIACGLEQALDYLEAWRFGDEAVAYLESLGLFADTFLDHLSGLRFAGEVWAVPEGETVFAGEPLLRVTAPQIEAQLVETFLLNCLTFPTAVASKAARVALACGPGRTFVDFSARRDHGADAALKAARAAYVGGATATSNVLAGRAFGIPLNGTMAHSYVLAFADEGEAFRSFARTFPDRTVLLIDTYDTEEGARRAARVAAEMAAEGQGVQGVRIDSGDLASSSRSVRRILDQGGAPDVRIVASGDLDEDAIAGLVRAGAPIDAFGVGTRLGTSADQPSLGSVYKLVEDVHGPKMKLSPGKATLPGRKQVHRVFDDAGVCHHDVIALDGEEVADGRPLLRRVMAGGRRQQPPEPLAALQARCAGGVAALPARLRGLDQADDYDVRSSPGLETLVEGMRAGSS